jgi:DNA-binding MarR family transcriptional regulator
MDGMQTMTDAATTMEDRLLNLFDRLRQLAFDQHPLSAQGISMPQLTLLAWIAAAPGSGIQEAAAGLGLTAPTVSVGVRRLEESGLLERTPDPQDGRSIRLYVTGQGQALHEQIQGFRRQKMRRLLTGLTPDEQITLLGLLEKAVTAAENKQHATGSKT